MTTRDVLRIRDFRLLFAGHGVSVFGDRMVVVALAFAVLEVGGSASEVGLVLAASWVPAIASVLVGGVLSDRISRRTVMVTADAVRVCSQGAMATLLITGSAEVWMLAALAGVTGAGMGFFNPAATGLLPDVVPADGLQRGARGRRSAPWSPIGTLAAGASVPVLALGAALSGAGLMLGMSVWETTLQRGIPPESLSRVASYDWFGSYAFYPLGLAAWGSIAGAIGVHSALWLAFGLFAAAAAALVAVPDVRHYPASRADAPVA